MEAGKSQRVPLAIGASVVLLVIAIARFCSPPSASSVVSASLSPQEVRQIVPIAAKQHWKLVRWAIAKREFKLLRYFATARIESAEVDPTHSGRVDVLCRVPFDPGVKVFLRLQSDGTNIWRYERWIVSLGTPKQVAQPSPPPAQTDMRSTVK
jgi:hypothetical protein